MFTYRQVLLTIVIQFLGGLSTQLLQLQRSPSKPDSATGLRTDSDLN